MLLQSLMETYEYGRGYDEYEKEGVANDEMLALQ